MVLVACLVFRAEQDAACYLLARPFQHPLGLRRIDTYPRLCYHLSSFQREAPMERQIMVKRITRQEIVCAACGAGAMFVHHHIT